MSEIIRWGPSRRAMSLRDMFDRFFEEGFLRPWSPWSWEATGTLALDMYETDEDFVVKAAVPGIDPEDLEVNISNNVLSIRGESKEEKKVEGAHYHRLERRYGHFERSVALPTRVDAEKVEAHLKGGVLTVTVPKVEEVKPKRITVKVQE